MEKTPYKAVGVVGEKGATINYTTNTAETEHGGKIVRVVTNSPPSRIPRGAEYDVGTEVVRLFWNMQPDNSRCFGFSLCHGPWSETACFTPQGAESDQVAPLVYRNIAILVASEGEAGSGSLWLENSRCTVGSHSVGLEVYGPNIVPPTEHQKTSVEQFLADRPCADHFTVFIFNDNGTTEYFRLKIISSAFSLQFHDDAKNLLHFSVRLRK